MKQNITLLDYTTLDKEQHLLILSWRNNQSIKKWMFTQKNITLEDHLSFVNSLNNNKHKQYFLVKQDKQYIGVVDFCNITQKSVTMGVYKNPELYGIGNILMKVIIDYSFKTLKVGIIYSEVFEENTQAIKLYKSFGFNPFNSKIINERKVICMELINENR